MTDIAIKVQNVSKQYKIGALKRRHDTLRDQITHGLKSLFAREGVRAAVSDPLSFIDRPVDSIWAIKDVSFEIKGGEVVGIIGQNGAGKSTLLKILSRITEPTNGRAEVYGRLGSLLEVGTGFHPELTGRENIYLNGIILGMKRLEIQRRFDEIVAFSEIEQFIDTPVKRYSSGMYVRLAFAVAAHLELDTMVVDEVLAVGDLEFQKKCLGKIGEVAKTGRTVILVSHNMGAVGRLCNRSIWMDQGKVAFDGTSSEAIRLYQSTHSNTIAEWSRTDSEKENESCSFLSIKAKKENGEMTSVFRGDEIIRIEMHYVLHRDLDPCQVGARLLSADGVTILGTEDVDGSTIAVLTRKSGFYRAVFSIPPNLLRPGRYSLLIGASSFNRKWYEVIERAIVFDVLPLGSLASDGRMGIISPFIEWETSMNPLSCSDRFLSDG